jgi:hypothetical protein
MNSTIRKSKRGKKEKLKLLTSKVLNMTTIKRRTSQLRRNKNKLKSSETSEWKRSYSDLRQRNSREKTTKISHGS